MRKLAKKLTAAMLAFVLALSVAACGLTPTQQAEAAVKDTFEAIKTLDFKKVAQYMGEEDALESDIFAELPNGGEEVLGKLFGKLQYEIVSSEEVTGEEVHVTTKITAVDMKPIFGQVMAKMLEYVFANAFSEAEPSEDEIAEKMVKIFDELLTPEDVALVTEEVVIKVVRAENGWQIETDSVLTNALLGGLEEVAAEMEEAFN